MKYTLSAGPESSWMREVCTTQCGQMQSAKILCEKWTCVGGLESETCHPLGGWGIWEDAPPTQESRRSQVWSLLAAVHLITNGISSIASLHHILIFSACKQCLCQRRTLNTSRIWLGGERCPRQGFVMKGRCSGPDSTCCVDSNYPRT